MYNADFNWILQPDCTASMPASAQECMGGVEVQLCALSGRTLGCDVTVGCVCHLRTTPPQTYSKTKQFCHQFSVRRHLFSCRFPKLRVPSPPLVPILRGMTQRWADPVCQNALVAKLAKKLPIAVCSSCNNDTVRCLCIGETVERGDRGILRYHRSSCLEGLRKTTVNFSG
jgi:hypothetical protein